MRSFPVTGLDWLMPWSCTRTCSQPLTCSAPSPVHALPMTGTGAGAGGGGRVRIIFWSGAGAGLGPGPFRGRVCYVRAALTHPGFWKGSCSDPEQTRFGSCIALYGLLTSRTMTCTRSHHEPVTEQNRTSSGHAPPITRFRFSISFSGVDGRFTRHKKDGFLLTCQQSV